MSSALLTGLQRLRRRATHSAIRSGLSVSARLGTGLTLGAGRLIGSTAGLPGPWRMRLRSAMRAAGLEASSEQLDRYFRLLGHWLGRSALVYNRGFADSGVAAAFDLAESKRYLADALALGRGAILVGFHYHCHELACAAVARQFPVVALAREGKDPARDAIKRRWYQAAGIETVLRSRQHASKFAEALDFLWVLRDNKVLAITPDVLGPEGVPVELFGRSVKLPGGMIALAMGLGTPVVFTWPRWSYGWLDRLTVEFDEPLSFSKRGDRAATLRAGMQQWARRFEAFLRWQPEAWQFWLDKRWSRVWRGER